MVEVVLAKIMEVDINSGFNNIVNPEMNEMLMDIQKNGGKIKSVLQPLKDGRKVLLTILYTQEMEMPK